MAVPRLSNYKQGYEFRHPSIQDLPQKTKDFLRSDFVYRRTGRQHSQGYWVLYEYDIYFKVRDSEKPEEYIGRKLKLCWLHESGGGVVEVSGPRIDDVFREFAEGDWPKEFRTKRVKGLLHQYPQSRKSILR